MAERPQAKGRNRAKARWRGRLAGVWLLCAGWGGVQGADGLVGVPLAARSGPRGPTLFAAVAPADSGLVAENRYADPRMWGELYQEFSVGAIGTGVAIGDYDGDGRPDVFVTSKTESCRLWRNLGGFRFEDVTDRAGVGDRGAAAAIWKQGAAFADVNNDGRLDLHVCRFGAPNLLYLNRGDGTFAEEAAARGLALSDASGMAAFADYDHDGWLDVYVQTNLLDVTRHPDGQPDRLYRNNGDGTFTDVTAAAGIAGRTQGHAAMWWDFDNDGWLDLYVANDFAAPDSLYRNNRDGTFTDVVDGVPPHTPYSSMGADLGDVNNDGRIDFLVADMAATTHQKDQRGMADSRSRAPADRLGDPATPQYLRNALLLNTGTGRLAEAALLAGLGATDWTWAVRLEDFDNDGRLDLHVTNGMVRELHNVDVLGRMMAAESPAERVRLMRSSPVLNEANLAYRNEGELRFSSVGPAWGLDQRGVSFGSATGDLDGDGDLDLVFANYQGGPTLLRNDSDEGHRLLVSLRGVRANRMGVGAVVQIETAAGVQVRQLATARGYLSTSEPVLHFGLGRDDRIDRLVVRWPGGGEQEYRDLAADQHLTITERPGPAVVRPGAPARFVETAAERGLGLGSREQELDETSRQPLLPFRHNRRGPALAVADLNGDRRAEIVIGGTTLDPLRIVTAGAGGGFSAPLTAPAAEIDDGPVLLFDADGDGTDDLLVTGGGSSGWPGSPGLQPRLLLNRPGEGFRPAPAGALPDFPVSVGAAAAADFNRDGRLDVFLGGRVLPGEYPAGPPSALLVNRGGRFEDGTDAWAPGLRESGMVTAAIWSDLDNDGWIDLLTASEWGTVRYWRNEAGRLVDRSAAAGFGGSTGWWSALAAADFNGDGRMDYVAGNAGLNTPYGAGPALLYAGNFGGGGPPQLLEAHEEDGGLYPRRARRELGAVLPGLSRRFPRNDVFARSTLAELVGSEALAKATRLTANELRSGVYLSQPDGTHRFAPLPRLAQIAPLQGVVAGDFDGDGHADIYAVQNSFAPVASIGRFDGGLSQFLRGDGRGGFEAESPAATGLVVPGDAKALVTVDFEDDGWPDFVVSRNHDTLLAFRQRGVPGRNSWRVELEGRPGNPRGIGARVTLGWRGGAQRTVEIGAGSGYYSQSLAAGFFGWEEANPPVVIRVRWPSGATTEHAVNPAAAVQRCVEPGP